MKAKYNYKVGQIYKFISWDKTTHIYTITEVGEDFLMGKIILGNYQKGSTFKFDISSIREQEQIYLGDNEQVVKVLYL